MSENQEYVVVRKNHKGEVSCVVTTIYGRGKKFLFGIASVSDDARKITFLDSASKKSHTAYVATWKKETSADWWANAYKERFGESEGKHEVITFEEWANADKELEVEK